MTSRHFFFKYMIEDLRHRVWMAALSMLGSFLSMPVAFLLVQNSYQSAYNNYLVAGRQARALEYLQEELIDTFSTYGCVSCGFIAVVGAVIVGLFGFRYLFRRDMVDTWHSLPVKRSTLFWVNYLNGFLIWFVPFVINLLITLAIASGDMVRSGIPGTLLGCVLTTVFVVTVSFLTVYNLVLLGVMLSGNVLNAMVSSGFVGLVAAVAYLIDWMGLAVYMDTFYSMPVDFDESALWLSPVISSVWILGLRHNVTIMTGEFLGKCLIVLLTAVLMLAASFAVYQKRPSEAAGGGVYFKGLSAVMRFVTAVAAGFGGWMFFAAVSGNAEAGDSPAWGIFGGILVSFLAYGVLDIVFSMGFKAFLSHKKAMIGAVVCSVLLGLSFSQDWYGYDTYLPSEARIEEAGIYLGYYYSGGNVLDRMHYTDSGDIYALLSNAAENARDQVYDGDAQGVTMRITLKNGRTYYRYYILDSACRESLVNVMESDTYVESVYGITDSMAETISYLWLSRGYESTYIRESDDIDDTRTRIAEALRKDIEEYGIQALYSEDTVYCTINFSGYDREDERYASRSFNITDQWVNTIQVLKDLGYGSYAEPLSAENVEYLSFYYTIDEEDFENTEDILLVLGEYFGVDMTGESLELDSEEYAELSSKLNEKGYVTLELFATDKEEIEEILALCDYNEKSYGSGLGGLFNENWGISIYAQVGDSVTDSSENSGDSTVYSPTGEMTTVSEQSTATEITATESAAYGQSADDEHEVLLTLRSGTLPKKYLLRMAESVKAD
ncbi:MAG: hypothetical protein LUC90_01480 [Lachnospiraceae bacterium]|nr:hypothetical protein [Lachnospiraceae bacterium]